jgi:ABC-type multidrug transport system ATPase subunit
MEKEQNHFNFGNISFQVTKGNEVKQIIDDVSGFVKSGECCAILGPSGAGKTSLLNCLTLSNTVGVCRGEVDINEFKMNSEIFKKFCCIVAQEDSHRAFLTCRQTVRFAADFYMQSSEEKKDNYVDELLEKLGLTGCANTRVGDQFIQGLSGGQKKRLSIAVALVKRPRVLFLDEPTSGLDAAAAQHVVSYIRKLTRDLDIITIATIHQPSTSIYFEFDRVLLLSKGRTAYFGTPKHSVEYFGSLGHTVPNRTNPAEYLLDLVNAEFTDPALVDKVLQSWKTGPGEGGLATLQSSPANQLVKSCSGEGGRPVRVRVRVLSSALPEEETSNSYLADIYFVMRRQCVIIVGDPMIYLGRAVMFLLACTFFAIIYIRARNRSQDQILNRLWLSLWMAGVPTSLGVIGVYSFNAEFKALLKEVKNGMFGMDKFLLATMIIQIPVVFMLSICATGIPAFAIADFYAPNWFFITAMYTCMLFCYESIARLLSVQFKNPLLGMLCYLNLWFSSFLFAGVMIPVDDVLWPFRVMCYILPLKWAFSSIAYYDAIDSEYSGATLCTDTSQANCFFHGNRQPGWTCSSSASQPIDASAQCYGHTGWQVLDSLGTNYDVIRSDADIPLNFGIIIGIAVCFQLGYMVVAYRAASQSSTIEPSNSKNENTKSSGSSNYTKLEIEQKI